jgi:predicted nucleic acid-binding protein
MKAIVFDAGTVISLAINSLLWLLEPLKKKFGGEFYITKAVKYELVDRPIKSKKYKLEAVMIKSLIRKGVIKVYEGDLLVKTNRILGFSNKLYSSNQGYLNLVQLGEVESLALVNEINADAFMVDERTIRMMVENPKNLLNLLTKKLHSKIGMNKDNLKMFQKEVGKVSILRSSELVVLAYEYGLLDKYITSYEEEKDLLEGVLWGTKLRGCSISVDEIKDIVKLEGLR